MTRSLPGQLYDAIPSIRKDAKSIGELATAIGKTIGKTNEIMDRLIDAIENDEYKGVVCNYRRDSGIMAYWLDLGPNDAKEDNSIEVYNKLKGNLSNAIRCLIDERAKVLYYNDDPEGYKFWPGDKPDGPLDVVYLELDSQTVKEYRQKAKDQLKPFLEGAEQSK
jgi:hypothetical protein